MSLRGFENYGVGSRSLSDTAVLSSPPSSSSSATVSVPSMSLSSVSPLGASLGGSYRATLLGMLSVPVPLLTLASAGARAFLFVNAGILGKPNFWKSPTQDSSSTTMTSTPIRILSDNCRLSMGCGISLPVGEAARIELTYSVPLKQHMSDVTKPFQIGLGITVN